MSKLINVFLLGSCAIYPTYVLSRLGFFPWTVGHLGFKCAPFALSSGAAVQTYDFCVGERKLSEPSRLLAYMTQYQPTPEKRHLVDDAELVFVEMSNTVEPVLGDDIVNLNYVGEYVLKPLWAAGADRQLVWAWWDSLSQVKPDLKERAQDLLANWPRDVPAGDPRRMLVTPAPSSPVPIPSVDDPCVRFAIEEIRSRRLEVDDMVRDLEILREKMRRPLTILLFDSGYGPDGRPMEESAPFKAQQIEIARRLRAPTLDFAPIVERYGRPTLINEDPSCRHFLPRAHPLQAEIMYDFWADLLDRPFLETWPEWREARPRLFEGLPPLFEGPARVAFPHLATYPDPARRAVRKTWRRAKALASRAVGRARDGLRQQLRGGAPVEKSIDTG